MSYVITSACVATCAAACVEECPVECIGGPVPMDELRKTPLPEREARFGRVQLFIDPDRCIDCSACAPVCPVSAIHRADRLPAGEEQALARNAAFFAA